MSAPKESPAIRLIAVGGLSATLGLIGFGVAMFTQLAIGWLPGRALDPNYRPSIPFPGDTPPDAVAAQSAAAVPPWVAWGICAAACLVGVWAGVKLAQVFLRHAAQVGRGR